MRMQYRSLRDIPNQPLPSIQTLFRPSLKGNPKDQSPVEDIPRRIEDGIEIVPLERQNSSTTKIVSPGTEEKEVVPGSCPSESTVLLELATKPLPNLPTKWTRMSTASRIIVILCLQFVILLTIGLSLVVARKKKHDRSQSPPPSIRSDITTAPSPTQTGLSIQHGTFALDIGPPQQQNSACLSQSNESAAWICSPRKVIQINILPSPSGDTNVTIVSIVSLPAFNTSIYGLQDPKLDPLELAPVIDTKYASDGPAYYFRTTYNHTVLLKEDQIVAEGQSPGPLDTGNALIQPGDRPWLCTFNDTIIEGFIYVSQNSTNWNNTFGFGIGNNTQATDIPYLPYAMKLTEERAANSTRPSCVRMLMQENGKLIFDGQAKMLTLSEVDFLPDSTTEGVVAKLAEQKKQQSPSPKTCQCQWMIQ